MSRASATLLLILATAIWGFAFIAQKSAMDYMGALSFIFARYLLGGLIILPLALREYKKQRNGKKIEQKEWLIMIFLGVNLFLGSWLQQLGIMRTSVTNSGFLTGLYVFFVPLILLLIFRVRPHFIIWFCTPLAIIGLYLLNGGGLNKLNLGDILVIFSAVFWALHVLGIGFGARMTKMPIFISCFAFIFAGSVSAILAFIFEAPNFGAISSGWVEIAYAGILSTAIAFTLQAVGQMKVPPANAAIIMSAESLFAALGGALILGERLLPIGYVGALLIFTSIILVETVPALKQKPISRS